jgi:hypothetical protein
MANSVGLDEDLKKIDYTMKLENLDAPRKQKYKNILIQLQDMGFLDFDRNLRTAERVGTDILLVMENLAKPEPVMGANPNVVQPKPFAQQVLV